jgi:serine protease inhibitor
LMIWIRAAALTGVVTNEMVVHSTKVHLWLDIPWIFIVKETAEDNG